MCASEALQILAEVLREQIGGGFLLHSAGISLNVNTPGRPVFVRALMSQEVVAQRGGGDFTFN